ncbi:hypothetical protein Adu01nite_09220 [Paractinoplanes durhamensis]|uniref:Uncharacterized protein n=1 Tax=Paractinoplanes durhamensis TaxID=113563 RepID=A0ABQ3YPU2_9ACTN|nr:hypothetical protein Adu01nite_09220 [Actinoplanes durhamensis]
MVALALPDELEPEDDEPDEEPDDDEPDELDDEPLDDELDDEPDEPELELEPELDESDDDVDESDFFGASLPVGPGFSALTPPARESLR